MLNVFPWLASSVGLLIATGVLGFRSQLGTDVADDISCPSSFSCRCPPSPFVFVYASFEFVGVDKQMVWAPLGKVCNDIASEWSAHCLPFFACNVCSQKC